MLYSQKKLSENCYFKEEMDGGYFLFSSIENPERYLGFNRNGKPINYGSPRIDKQCRKIFKRITEESSNGLSTSTINYEPTSLAANNNNVNNHHHRHKSSTSTRIHQKTHSNRIEANKSRSASTQTSSKRNKSQPHPVRHHHNEQPLRHYHTINDNKNIDSKDNLSSTKQLGNEDLNAIYNHNDSGVNTISENKIKPTAHNRHLKKPTQSVSKLSKKEPGLDDQPGSNLGLGHKRKDPNSTNDNLGTEEYNNDTNNNCTYSTKNTEDETDDKTLKGRKNVKSRNNAHAIDKPNNKCNNNNRRHRKNNENGRHSRKPSQKSSSHKNQTSEPLNLN